MPRYRGGSAISEAHLAAERLRRRAGSEVGSVDALRQISDTQQRVGSVDTVERLSTARTCLAVLAREPPRLEQK